MMNIKYNTFLNIFLLLITLLSTQCSDKNDQTHPDNSGNNKEKTQSNNPWKYDLAKVKDFRFKDLDSDTLLLELDYDEIEPWDTLRIRRKDRSWSGKQYYLNLNHNGKNYANKLMLSLDPKREGVALLFDTEYELCRGFMCYSFKTPKFSESQKYYPLKLKIKPLPLDLGAESKSPFILDIELVNSQPKTSVLRVGSKNNGWGGLSYGLEVSRNPLLLAKVVRLRLGDKQTNDQWLFDSEYEFYGLSGSYVTYKTPKKQKGKTHYRMQVEIPTSTNKNKLATDNRKIKLEFDLSGLGAINGFIDYESPNEAYEVDFKDPLTQLKVKKLGGEFAVYEFDDNKKPSYLLALAYLRKVDKSNLGKLNETADWSVTKVKPVRINLLIPSGVKDAQDVRFYVDEKAVNPIAWMAVKAGQPVRGKVYPGKWIVKWNLKNRVILQKLEVKKDGTVSAVRQLKVIEN